MSKISMQYDTAGEKNTNFRYTQAYLWECLFLKLSAL